ncbi:outer membrane transport energization protein ExbD [Humidesulfovibrio mexicanus]|uniref:Outer membrane transport energization protein ExbD n=1 Tax=Humidesulfovibrio mexicanus TaxID=147047 RepID=A0A238YUT4_9BACT|nr:biopolymer transporter ExbD [Humidesulfovibrio mexicanus]SNR74343.1 outer membrane transport energization protein ExbD [Humidesulfovibrio mexicanus]
MISFKRCTPKPSSPDITSLLDVVFILLLFFVVSSVFTARGMDMELPDAETAHPVSGKSMEIQLAADGSLSCDGNPATLRDLSFILERTAGLPPASQPGRILLKAQPEAHVDVFVRVVDMVRKHGFSNVVIATRTSGQPANIDGDAQ